MNNVLGIDQEIFDRNNFVEEFSQESLDLLDRKSKRYLNNILDDREQWKADGFKYVSIEKNLDGDEYGVYTLADYMLGNPFRFEIVETIIL